MRSKFPLLSKIIFSDLYRTLVATSLVIMMIWSLNDPRKGGWLVLFFLGIWCGVRFVQKRDVRGHPLLLLGLVYGLYLCIPKSVETSIPMFYFATTMFWMALVYAWLIYDTGRGYLDRRSWENAVMLTGAIVVFQMIGEMANLLWSYQTWLRSLAFEAPQISYRLSGGLTYHPNNLAALLNTFWPLVLVRTLQARTLWTRLMYGIFLLLIFGVLIATNSRGGILATTAMVGLILVYLLLEKYASMLKKPAAIWRSIPRREKILGGLALVGVLGIAAFVFWRAAFTGTQTTGLGSRDILWENSIKGYVNAPLFGSGAGSFVLNYAQAAGLPPGFLAPHAHNLELQILVISGVVGLLFLLLAIFLIFNTFFRVVRKISGRERAQFVLPGIFLAGMLVHNQFDYTLEGSPANTVFYVILLALFLVADHQNQGSRSRKVWVPVMIAVVLLFAFALTGLQTITNGQGIYERNLALISDAKWEEAYPEVCEISANNPSNQFYRFLCSRLKSLAGVWTGEQNLLVDALEAQSAAIDSNPWWPVNRANFAGLLWWSGERERALEEMQTAVEGARQNAALSLNYGLMADQMGDTQTAKSAFISAMINDAMLVGNPRFDDTPSWKSAQATLRHLIDEIESWEEFMRIYPDAPFFIEENWILWRGLAAARSGDLEFGRDTVIKHLQGNPDGIWANAYAAQILNQLGESGEAEKYAEIARLGAERNLANAGALFTGNSTSWRSFAISGHVFRVNGRAENAKNSLLLSYKLLTGFSPSTGYNRFVYYNYTPSWDLDATLEWGILSPELEADFRWLAETLASEGDFENSQQIENWLEIQIQPKLEFPRSS